MLKKLTNFLTSLKFGIILFLIIALYSIIGTVIPQGMDVEFYLHQYKALGRLMVFLQFDNVYSSTIFIAIVFTFTINLVGCTINILPVQLRKMKDDYTPKTRKDSENLFLQGCNIDDFIKRLKTKKFKIIESENEVYAVKHRIGNIGSSVTHLGIVIIILGAVLGNMFVKEGLVSLVPGEMVEFDEGFSLLLDDFYMDLREDGSVQQYYSEFSVYEGEEKIAEEKIWVNNPLSYRGLYFYQSNYGWASKLNIKDKNGNILYESVIKGSRHDFYQPEHLTIYLYGFFPDFSMDRAGNPISISQEMNNPHYAVVLYDEKEYVDSYIVPPGQPIEYNDIEIEFVDSVLYTGITYRQDYGYYFVLLGSIILTLGIILSFYYYPKYILITSDSIIPIARQNIWGFTIRVKDMLKKIENGEGVGI